MSSHAQLGGPCENLLVSFKVWTGCIGHERHLRIWITEVVYCGGGSCALTCHSLELEWGLVQLLL